MSPSDITERLAAVGEILGSIARGKAPAGILSPQVRESAANMAEAAEAAAGVNPWFIRPFVTFALKAWSEALAFEHVKAWLERYDCHPPANRKTVGVVMAGNIPMVGLHDLLCVLVSGHYLQAKLSGDDDLLIPAIAGLITAVWPEAGRTMRFTGGTIGEVGAVIATGSNNTARYFEYYFGKYPHIIRKNRNGLAILTTETDEPGLAGLSDDMLTYFGLGCRSVSKIFVPAGFDLDRLMTASKGFSYLAGHSKYRNNYDYQKSILLVNGVSFYDNGFLLAREHTTLASPVAMVHFERYSDIDMLRDSLALEAGNIQCVVTDATGFEGAVGFGRSQFPGLLDYADGVDTMAFLMSIS